MAANNRIVRGQSEAVGAIKDCAVAGEITANRRAIEAERAARAKAVAKLDIAVRVKIARVDARKFTAAQKHGIDRSAAERERVLEGTSDEGDREIEIVFG